MITKMIVIKMITRSYTKNDKIQKNLKNHNVSEMLAKYDIRGNLFKKNIQAVNYLNLNPLKS
jgi:hypothetical protein